MQTLKYFSDKYPDISQKSLELLTKLATETSLKKNEPIVKLGDISKYFYLIKSGVVRSFYEDEKGKQYIRTIFTANKTTGCLSSLISEGNCKLTYECLTDCELYKFNFKEFKKLIKKNHEIAILYGKMLENVFLLLESKIYDLSVLDATERYLKLKNEIVNIEDLIPQYHIASYLNISPVQLSRIRKKMYSK